MKKSRTERNDPLRDGYSRIIDYLRLSVTDRCNLRCIYCMPAEGVTPWKHADILSYEEITRIVGIAAGLGVKKVRITGGEPLTRKNITFLVRSIAQITGIEDLTMTTNGVLLERYAQELADAGLRRINVSLDSFRPDRYREMTRGGDLEAVLRGIRAAEKAGLLPIKINMVPVKGLNDDEVEDFARLTLQTDWQVRFIELMPTGSHDFWSPDRYITTDDVRKRIEAIGPLEPVKVRSKGPSRYFRLAGARGVVGFISALTHHFCSDCNRLRLTADGKLRPCLFSETEIDLRSALRGNADDAEIGRLLRLAIEVKPEGHTIGTRAAKGGSVGCGASGAVARKPMSRIGG